MSFNFQTFDPKGEFAEQKAKKAFTRRERRDRAKETVQKSSLETAGEIADIGAIGREANRSRRAGKSPSFTQTKQSSPGTIEQVMAARDTLDPKYGKPTSGEVDDPEREAFRSFVFSKVGPDGKVDPEFHKQLLRAFDNAKVTRQVPKVEDWHPTKQQLSMQGGVSDVPITQAPGLLAGDLLKSGATLVAGGFTDDQRPFDEQMKETNASPTGRVLDAGGQLLGSIPAWAGQLAEGISNAKTVDEALNTVVPIDLAKKVFDPKADAVDKGIGIGTLLLAGLGAYKGVKSLKGESFKAQDLNDPVKIAQALDGIELQYGHETAQGVKSALREFDKSKFTDDLLAKEGPLEFEPPPDFKRTIVTPERPQEGAVSVDPQGGGAWSRSAQEAKYPPAGERVDGRTIGDEIKNEGSIESSLTEYTELDGIREVPVSIFGDNGPPQFYSASEKARTQDLAEQIRQSGHVDPLIVIDDGEHSPYILEGGHRFDALKMLGAKSFPAKVVIDEDAVYDAVKKAIAEGKPVPPEVLADYPDLKPVQSVNEPVRPKDTIGEGPPLRIADGSASPDAAIPGAKTASDRLRPAEGNSEGNPSSTGLANQVQSREAEASILKEVEATKGKSAEEWQKIGREKVGEGADYHELSKQVANGEVELTGERVGILLEGKRELLGNVNKARERLSKSPGDKNAIQDLDTAQTILDDYVLDVQAGKGRWADVGRALQAGTQLDTGDFSQVVQHLKDRGVNTSKLEAQLKEATDEIAKNRAEIERLKSNPAEYGASQAVARVAPRTRRFDKAGAQKRISENVTRLKEIRGTQGVGSGKTRGAASKITAEDLKVAKDQAVIVKDIALDWARANIGANLEDAVIAVQKIFRAEGLDIDRDAIVHALNDQEFGHGMSEATESANRVRGEARLEGNIAEKEANLAGKRSYRVARRAKKEKTVSEHIEDLQARDKLLDARLRNKLKAQETPMTRRAIRGTADTLRGLKLGRDFGVAFRQGLFAVARPRTMGRALRKASQTMFSEENLAKWATQQETKRYADGKLAMKVRKEAGLDTTDALSTHEEMVLPVIAKKLLGEKLGGSLERGQTTFINTVRTELFDSLYEKGANAAELKQRARFINNTTGRGNIGQVPEALQVVFTSPKYEASRWGTIGESVRNFNLNNAGARENMKDLIGTAATVIALGKAAELSGYTFNWQDPKESDWLKLRRGNEVWDVTAGIAPRLRDMVAYMAAMVDPKYRATVGDQVEKTVTRTFSPGITTPAKMVASEMQRARGVKKPKNPITGYEFKGHEDDLAGLFLTLGEANAIETMVETGQISEAAGAYLKEFVGTSVNRYPKRRKKTLALPDLDLDLPRLP